MRQLLTDFRGNPIFTNSRRSRVNNDYNGRGIPRTMLLHIRNRSWREVLRRCKSHPHEILTRDEQGSGDTPLHVACQLDPSPDVVRAMKHVSRAKNKKGVTPLHVAASHRCSAEALKILLECNTVSTPTSTMRSNDFKKGKIDENTNGCVSSPTTDLSQMGRAPIHYACMSFRGLGIGAFRLLLDATLKNGFLLVEDDKLLKANNDLNDDEEFVDRVIIENQAETSFGASTTNVMKLRDSTGHTPLGLLFRRYRERMKHVINTIDQLRVENTDSPQRVSLAAAMKVHADLGQLWEKARYMVARLTQERWESEGVELTTNPISPSAKAAALYSREQYYDSNQSQLSQNASPISEATVSRNVMDTAKSNVIEMLNNDLIAGAAAIQKDKNIHHRRFRIVHASVGLIGYGCPPEMIRLAISIHPDQVCEMDEDGYLPLHIAATSASYLVCPPHDLNSAAFAAVAVAAAAAVTTTDSLSDDESSIVSDALSFFSTATVSRTTNAFDKVIKMLLKHYPAAATIPQGCNGRLPLVMAIEAGRRTWGDGISSLLHAYPEALLVRKIPAYLYPNLLALITNNSNIEEEIDKDCRQKCRSVLPFLMRRRKKKKSSPKNIHCLTTLFVVLKTNPGLVSIKSEH